MVHILCLEVCEINKVRSVVIGYGRDAKCGLDWFGETMRPTS